MVLLFGSTSMTFTVEAIIGYVTCYKVMLNTMFYSKFNFWSTLSYLTLVRRLEVCFQVMFWSFQIDDGAQSTEDFDFFWTCLLCLCLFPWKKSNSPSPEHISIVIEKNFNFLHVFLLLQSLTFRNSPSPPSQISVKT